MRLENKKVPSAFIVLLNERKKLQHFYYKCRNILSVQQLCLDLPPRLLLQIVHPLLKTQPVLKLHRYEPPKHPQYL